MNVKKEVIERVKAHLIREQDDIHSLLRRNKREMERLVYEQTTLKRQIAKYGELLKGL
ncbi:SlyX protein [Candidatus Pacearchaeota archaeon]|nr:SlyX protein [Candidatus Pacearchaeota archaeon]